MDVPLDFTGVTTALVTPFRDGALDEPAFIRLVERQVEGGVRSLLVGSHGAGEAATLQPDEVIRLTELCVAIAGAGVTVIADASCNATAAAITLVRQAERIGAHGVLVIAPWYNCPSQDGIFCHFEAIAEAAALPLMIGNRPDRARVSIELATVRMLAGLPNVMAMADWSLDVARITAVQMSCPEWMPVLTGRDSIVLGALAHGAQGVVSVTANVAPEAAVAVCGACLAGDWERARTLHRDLFELHEALNADPLPSAVKAALAIQGVCGPEVRQPITACDAETIEATLGILRRSRVSLMAPRL